jgi:DNA-binding response OmpR family regulator
LEITRNQDIDLIILDLILPGMDGFDICKEVRKMDQHTPIMMLTARTDEIDKVLGLEFGADDYLTKPFSIGELRARVKAIFRRMEVMNKSEDTVHDLHFGELTIEVERHNVIVKGERIELTPKEFELLHLMASHPGRTYTRDQLLDMVWGYQYSGYEHTVNSHINRLRNKIEKDPSNPEFILTAWGLGYRFNDRLPKG